MPKLLFARAARDADEERRVRKLAASRHAPGDWIRRAQMVARSWDGLRTSAIAVELGCHQQRVRERLARFNAEGLAGLGDLQEAWWRLFRRAALAGQSFANDREIARATTVATAQLNRRARPCVWGQPPRPHRPLRRLLVYRI